MKPKVDLQIGELILRGLPYAQRHRIAAAFEQELAHLIQEQGVPPSFLKGGSVPSIRVDGLPAVPGASPKIVGVQIARQVYFRLAESTPQGH
jgi:hypothetical protein